MFGLNRDRRWASPLSFRFPNPVPAGTRVPQWALLRIPVSSVVGAFATTPAQTVIPSSQSANYWSSTAAEHVGGKLFKHHTLRF
jgi:hypothetical protein